jgi:hypothetical protein
MKCIGFSTGALARGDFRRALQMLSGKNVNAVELSALRQDELAPLVQQLGQLDLSRFQYISFHAPSAMEQSYGCVYAVDTWKGSDEAEHHRILKGQPEEWLFNKFKKNLLDHITSLKVTAVNATSEAAASLFKAKGETFDMIFIDASHDHANVKADLAAWFPLLAPGGLFCGHDFSANHPGVMPAVTEFFSEPGRVKKMAGGSIWFVWLSTTASPVTTSR